MFELACSGRAGRQLLEPSAMFASSYKRKHSLFGAMLLLFFFLDLKGELFPSRECGAAPCPSKAENDEEAIAAHLVHHLSNIHTFPSPVEVFLGDLV